MRKFAGIFAGVLLAAAAGAYFSSGANAAANDLVITGQGEGGPANVRTWGPDGKDGGTSYNANGTSGSGVRVAAGDITGDGVSEIVTGTGPGLNAQVQVWSGDGKTLIAQNNPFPGFTGGIFVAAANEDETNAMEVIVAAGPGGGPHVKVLRLVNGQLQEIYGFMAYDQNFHGGVHVAASGGRIITGPGAGGGPHVRVFRIFLGEISVANEWMAYASAFNGGVNVAAGALRSPNAIDVVTGAGPGGGPHVKVFSLDGQEGPGYFAYDPKFTGGVNVAVGMNQRLITGAGAGGGPHVFVRSLHTGTFAVVSSFFAYDPKFSGGVFVGGFASSPVPPTTTTACVGIPPLCLPGGGSTTTTAAPGTTTTTHAPTTTSTSTTSSTTSSTTTSTSTTPTTLALPPSG
jgi:hypothetical protein